MRKTGLIFIVTLLLAAACAGALAYDALPEDAGFILAAETETRALLLDEKTMQVRLVNKETGERLDTAALNGKIGNKSVKNTQKSTLIVNYITNAKNGAVSAMDSYSKSIQTGSCVWQPIKNGVELRFTIGDDMLIVDDLPKGLRADKYQRLLEEAGWTSKQKKTIRENYRAVRLAGMEYEYMIRVKDDSLSVMMIKELYKLIFESGIYTQEDMAEDNAAIDHKRAYLPELFVAVRFQLDGEDLLVTIPAEEIAFTEENEVTTLDLLPYFLRADQTESGYLFVPDGSGALIECNNGKTAATAYQARVYGRDALVNAGTYATPTTNVALPVYGLKTENSAVLAIIEQGAELASIHADVSGKSDEFNRVYCRFTLREIENVSLAGNESVTSPRFNSDVYSGDIVVRYRLLSGENADYTGMARTYRDYLLRRGVLTERADDPDAPFYVEVVGAVAKKKFFAGVPYMSSVQATTIAQAGEIYDALRKLDVKNIRMIFSGLFYGGVKHAALTRADLDGGMGGARQLSDLAARLEQNGDALYPGVYAGRVYGTRGFSKLSQAPRRHDGEVAEAVVFAEPIMKKTFTAVDGYYVSPEYLAEYAEKAVKSLSRYHLGGLAVFDLGETLVGNNKRGENLSRTGAVPRYAQAFETLGAKYALLLDRPALYALPYAAAATNLPTSDNGYQITDASIPFLQMVLEGCVPCSATSWNLSAHSDLWREMLFAMESKSAPRFTFTYQSPEIFHHTQDMDYMAYYATQYTQWLEKAAAYYDEYSAFYRLVRDARISGHALLPGGLRRVTYDNGVIVWLNYGDAPAQADGATVAPHGYRISKEELP